MNISSVSFDARSCRSRRESDALLPIPNDGRDTGSGGRAAGSIFPAPAPGNSMADHRASSPAVECDHVWSLALRRPAGNVQFGLDDFVTRDQLSL